LRALAPQALVFGLGATAEKVAQLRAGWPDAPMTFLSLGPDEWGDDLLELARETQPVDLHDPSARVASSQTASISFTGGTTGAPKGVVRSQRALACSVATMLAEWDWPSELRFLALAPLTHATGSMVPAVLLRGGSVHVRAGFDVDDVHRQVVSERITATFLVPTMIYRLLDRPPSDDGDLGTLRLIIYGAAAISPHRLAAGLGRWGPIFMQLYGQVEAPNTICTLRIAEHRADDPARLASCGRPTLNVEVALMDADGVPVPPGLAGEICVRGPLVMDGYLDDPAATSAAMRDGWLRTGDLAVSDDDGYLTIVDRIKDMIVTGGFNIFAGDVERALGTHPLVRDCAVIGVPDEVWGESVLAYVVAASGPDIDRDTDTLGAHVRTMKGPAWVPRQFVFVTDLPVTALGKPDKKALRARHWDARVRAVH
jgi:fatty-acyl-CoA synthase